MGEYSEQVQRSLDWLAKNFSDLARTVGVELDPSSLVQKFKDMLSEASKPKATNKKGGDA